MEVKKTVDNVDKVMAAVNALTAHDVLIGVPADKTGRSGKEPVTNASLAYIHEFGSPAHNIPPRPFLIPGVHKAWGAIVDKLRQGAITALNGGTKEDAMKTLHAVGMIGRNSVVREINSPSPPFRPLKPATVRARLRRTQAGRRQLTKIGKDAVKAGISSTRALLNWAGAGNAQPLIDTTQLRSSISYVIRETKKPDYVLRKDIGIVNLEGTSMGKRAWESAQSGVVRTPRTP